MFLPTPIACDVCKAMKTPSNHWFYAHIEEGSEFLIQPWDECAEDPDDDMVIHLCGQACAVKKLAEWMNAQSTEPKQTAAALDSAPTDHDSTDQSPKDSLS